MKYAVLSFVTIALLAGLNPLAFAQTQPTTQPMVADSLPPGWEEIDQRLIFFTIQLASVETSLNAVDKALKQAGYHQLSKQNEAQRYEHGNEIMDRNAGGPVSWQDFYGKTAERFFYHPDLDITVTKLNSQDLKRSSPDNLSQLNMPGPASERPPQFDYIYRANENAQRRAEADVAALGGKIDALVARRRQLEAEQAGIWGKIAFQAVASRRFTSKPLYRFDVTIDGKDDTSKQRQQAIHDGTEFVRLAVQAVWDAENVVDNDPMATFDALHRVIDSADTDLNARLTRLPALALDSGDPSTSLGRLVASVDRLNEVTKNISDSYHSALEGDQAGDDQQKQTFRAYAQQALFDCATNIYTTTECMSVLSHEWKVGIDVQNPIAAPTTTAVAAVTAPAEAKPVAMPSNSSPPPQNVEPPSQKFVPTPQPPAPGGKNSDLGLNTAKIENWTIQSGSWELKPDGTLRGEGDSMIELDQSLPGNVRISFHMNVIQGLRPRIFLDGSGIYFGNEGYKRHIFVYGSPQNVQGSPVPYKNGQGMDITITLLNGKFEAKIGDELISGGCIESTKVQLRLRAGDGWSQGTTEFSDFRIDPL
jgi:hypothetical protein